MKFNRFPSLNNVFEDFFNHDFAPLNRQFTNSTPSVNIKENEEGFSLEVAAPGLSKEDFKLSIDQDILSISCEKKVEHEAEEGSYTRREFAYTSFQRAFSLPETVNSEQISANYQDGILKVHIPKKEEAKPKPARQIEIA